MAEIQFSTSHMLQKEDMLAQRGGGTCPRAHSNRRQKWAPLADSGTHGVLIRLPEARA